MIEYINKHATAEHIDMYAKLLTMGDYRSGMMKAKEILLNQESEDIAPTAPKIIRGTDIVQVVRCKECKHYQPSYCKVWSKYGTIQTRESGYCYMAEQREECKI